MLKFNYDFDIAALLVIIVISAFYLRKKHVNDTKYRVFSWLLFFTALTPISDIVGSVMVAHHITGSPFILVDVIYYLSYQMTTFCFMGYIFVWLEVKGHSSMIRKIKAFLPITVSSVIIILNPIFKWFSAYGEFNYHRGYIQEMCHLVSLFYLVWAVIYVSLNRKVFNRSMRFTVYNVAIIYMIPMIVMAYNRDIQLHNFADALIILLIICTIQLHESSVDQVTGLMKKNHLCDLCQKQFFSKAPFDIIMIRVGDYDLLNSSYGAPNTERFMEELGTAIHRFVPVGRSFKVSNSLFAVVPEDKVNVAELAKQIYERLEQPWKISDVEMVCSSFVTRVSYPENIKDMDSLNAYLTYFEKMKRMRYGIVDVSELDVKDKIREAQVEKAIELGIEKESFEVYYQPICDAKTQKFVTAEALVRLTDPELGPISPMEFIPIAERNGSIIHIGNFVLDTVCEFIEKHDMDKLGLHYIELNLSTIQCLQRDFITTIENIVARHKVSRSQICLEITETASNCAPAIFTENLEKVKELGYLLALDDFGTGYGNLDRMTSSNFDIIKFDKSMIQRMYGDERMHRVFRYMMKMSQSLNIEVVAEGVETKEMYEFVRESDGDYIQGYYFSRPLPEKEVIEYLESHQ